ncbi:MAG: hypothetical protein Q4E17_07515, partial [Synergistes sp.]|nr:hypothetical protein [Synergistes sp.]
MHHLVNKLSDSHDLQNRQIGSLLMVNKPASLTEIKDFLSQPRVTVRPRLWLQRIDIRLGEQTKF